MEKIESKVATPCCPYNDKHREGQRGRGQESSLGSVSPTGTWGLDLKVRKVVSRSQVIEYQWWGEGIFHVRIHFSALLSLETPEIWHVGMSLFQTKSHVLTYAFILLIKSSKCHSLLSHLEQNPWGSSLDILFSTFQHIVLYLTQMWWLI